MPQAAGVPGSAVYKKKLYCIGGWDASPDGNLVNAVQIYQP
jgi:Kelch motif